ncbi:Protein of unknown function [Propionibacterium freudenreichii]|nr:Protein of unknown function [Propionibacterium freudenreichii]CEI32438.1 Protein of unknown function [Propionibacterium freudenreichii]
MRGEPADHAARQYKRCRVTWRKAQTTRHGEDFYVV